MTEPLGGFKPSQAYLTDGAKQAQDAAQQNALLANANSGKTQDRQPLGDGDNIGGSPQGKGAPDAAAQLKAVQQQLKDQPRQPVVSCP